MYRAFHNVEVARTSGEFAIFLLRTGDFASAEVVLRNALRIDSLTIGPGHGMTARHRLRLGRALLNTGRPSEALPEFRQSARVFEAVNGSDTPITLEALSREAQALMALDDRRAVDSILGIIDQRVGEGPRYSLPRTISERLRAELATDVSAPPPGR